MELNKFLRLKLPPDVKLATDILGLETRKHITVDEFAEFAYRNGWPKDKSVGLEKRMYEFQRSHIIRNTPYGVELSKIKKDFGILADFKRYVAAHGWPRSKMNGKVLNDEQKIERSMWLFQSEVLSGKRYAGKPEYKKELEKLKKGVRNGFKIKKNNSL